MRINKRFVVLCVVLSLIFCNAYALDTTATEDVIEDGYSCKILTEQEYVDLLVEKKGMSESDATAKAHTVFNAMSRSRAVQGTRLAAYSKVYYPNNGCKNYGMGVDVGFTAYITLDNYPSFVSIEETWATAYGSGPHTYSGTNGKATIRSSYEVQVTATGQLEVAVQNGVSTEGNITAGELVQIGYSVATSSGYTTYYRIPVSANVIIKQSWAN